MAREQHRYVGSLVACGVGLGVVVAWVLLAKPAEGWFGLPVALVGVPCAIGVVVLGIVVGLDVVSRPAKRHVLIESPVPTLIVEFDDGRASNILALSHVERLGRIETLLRRQMEAS